MMHAPLVSPEMVERLSTLEGLLRSQILGQEEPIAELTLALQRTFCGIRFPNRPVLSGILLGPTGVGKTRIAELVTEHLYGSPEKFVRIDLSEYQEQRAVGLLLGANLGERGLLGLYYDQAGGSGMILLDEIEKAHPRFLDLLLQALSAARITVASGETLNLRNFIILATSNMGSQVLAEGRATDRTRVVKRALEAAKATMRPEIYRRFECKIVFNRMTYEVLQQVGDLHLSKVLEGIINAQGHDVRCEPEVVEAIHAASDSEQYGAAPVEDAALDVLGKVVSQAMLKNKGRPVRGVIRYNPETRECFLS